MDTTGAALFDPFVSYASVRFAAGDEARFASVRLPAALDRAVDERKLEFLAGRYCAERALRRLVADRFEGPIAIGSDRAPVWPASIVGAITHTGGFAAAAVAHASDTAGVGLDSEPIVSASAMDAVGAKVATREEMDSLAGAGLEGAVLLTVVFSAKESLFKCLHRHVGRYFDFHDAAIVEVKHAAGTFTAELRTGLGDRAAGTTLGGRFVLDDGFVHTGITLPP
jgi:enterobactin synthetase component D